MDLSLFDSNVPTDLYIRWSSEAGKVAIMPPSILPCIGSAPLHYCRPTLRGIIQIWVNCKKAGSSDISLIL